MVCQSADESANHGITPWLSAIFGGSCLWLDWLHCRQLVPTLSYEFDEICVASVSAVSIVCRYSRWCCSIKWKTAYLRLWNLTNTQRICSNYTEWPNNQLYKFSQVVQRWGGQFQYLTSNFLTHQPITNHYVLLILDQVIQKIKTMTNSVVNSERRYMLLQQIRSLSFESAMSLLDKKTHISKPK